MLQINLTGVFITVAAAAPYLREGASVILTGSVLANAGLAGYAGYAATKAGVRSMARAFASELADRNIRVNIVSPGPIATPIWGAAAATPEAQQAFAAYASRSIPQGRLGTADEVARAVLFLASDESSYVQAADLAVDGGMNGAPSGALIYRQGVN